MKKIIYLCATALLLFTSNACNKEELQINPLTSSSNGDNSINATARNSNASKGDICHNGNTININMNALQSHLGHGDIPGSCGNPLPANSWYFKVGLTSITEAKNNSLFTDAFFQIASDQIRAEFEDDLSDEFLFDNKKRAFAFTSKTNPKRTLLLASKGGTIESRIITITSTDVTLSDIGEANSITLPIMPSPQQTPNCDDLGPPLPGEGFVDCFVRNFSNFPCDFLGVVVIATNPGAVILAIEAVCIFGA
ncbi:MAG: hypothetical protein COA97_05740 [Flavobacteriales bacterium]|nr:MAG: hypothetical protein COA97_05740 [Flavobacteriales bacterium]